MLSRLSAFPVGVLWLIVPLLSGCSYMTRDTVPPRVQLLGVQLQAAQLFEQRYLLQIRIQNHNDFDLDINGIEFNVELNDEPFAQGVSNKAVSVPGFGEAITEVSVSSSILTLMQQMSGGGDEVRYRVAGRVKLKGIPIPVSFESQGDLSGLAKGPNALLAE